MCQPYIKSATALSYDKKKHLLVNKKGDVGMAKCFSKNYGNRGCYQLCAIRKLCQDACQRLMLHPYITASRTSS